MSSEPSYKVIRRRRDALEAFLVVVTAVLIALVSWKFYARFDITKDKMFSLSSATINLIRNVPGRINAELFISRALPPDAQTLSERISDLLSEYEARSAGNFRYRLIDPTNNPEAKRRAENMGIPEIQMQVLRKDELQVVNVHLGLVLLYEDKKETIPVLKDITNLEYEITSRIVKLTREEPPVIGIADFSRRFTFQEQAPESRYTELKSLLRDRFTVKDVDLEADYSIPDDVQTLLILNPMGLSKEAQYVVDQFLMRGGSLIVPAEAVMMTGQGLQAYPSLPGIETLLEKYGLTLKKQMVLDASNAVASFGGAGFVLSMRYPMWVKVLPQNFNSSLPFTTGLESLVLPWSGYFELKDDAPKNVTFEPLFKSTEQAWLMKSPFNLDPQQDFSVSRLNAEIGQFTLGYLMRGKLPSAFAKDGPPKIPEDAEEERRGKLESALDPANFKKEGEKEATVLATASGRFLEDGYLRQFSENAIFIENAVDWLSQGEVLIGIRSRGATARPIKVSLTEPAKNLIRYGNMVGIPLLLALYGIFRWMLRLRRRLYVKQKYAITAGGSK